MSKPKIYAMSFGKVYPLYVAKATRKGRTKEEVDHIVRWLTGYDQPGLEAQIKKEADFESFIAQSPRLNPLRKAITGKICGVRIEDIEEETMREIRYLDKLIDELAKGKSMAKILRENVSPANDVGGKKPPTKGDKSNGKKRKATKKVDDGKKKNRKKQK